jgi:hypothetical protein
MLDGSCYGRAMSESPDRHSAAADAAALRWSEKHPEDDVEHPPPATPPEPEDEAPKRRSASAEAAALRYRSKGDEPPG